MSKYSRYVRKYWCSFLLGQVFMVLESCGAFLLPYINAQIINIGAANGDIPYILRHGLLMLGIACLRMVAGMPDADFAIPGAARPAAGPSLRTLTPCSSIN